MIACGIFTKESTCRPRRSRQRPSFRNGDDSALSSEEPLNLVDLSLAPRPARKQRGQPQPDDLGGGGLRGVLARRYDDVVADFDAAARCRALRLAALNHLRLISWGICLDRAEQECTG